MAGFKGSSKIISSSYLYTQLQALYTKIKGLIDKKADKIHTHSEYQNNIKIHEKIDLKSGTFLSCITEQINKGYRGGKIEINDYCPEDTCNENHWGFVEWTCNENQFIHMFFYSDRWEVIHIRECCVAENHDTGWHRIGNDCDAWTLNGWHGDNYMFNYRGYGSGYFNSMNVNDWIRSGIFATQEGNTNLPSERGADTWGTMFIIVGLDDRVSQYAVFWNEEKHPLWHRHLNGTSWSTWSKINNGGDSDTLDGYHSDNFVRKTGDAMTGNLVIGDATFHTDGNIYLPNSAWSYMKNCYLYDVLNNLNARVNSLPITGYGENGLTYYQTNGDFEGSSDWCHYIIANHGNGGTYYNYTIGLPFWGSPIYQRQTGNTSARSGWQKFHTTETITKGTWGLTPGVSSLANDHIYIQYE